MTKRLDPTKNQRGKTGKSRKLIDAVHRNHGKKGNRGHHGWAIFRDGIVLAFTRHAEEVTTIKRWFPRDLLLEVNNATL